MQIINIENTTSFRMFLQQELMRRCQRNSRYSVRAFARALGIENSALSKILSGKRKITPIMQSRLAKQLGLGPKELSQFAEPSFALADHHFQQLTLDQFSLIVDWYHYAILELARLKHFQSNSRWISKTLGISISEVNIAIERLVRLGYLERTKSQKLILKTGPTSTLSNDSTDVAFRKLQKQVLEMAILALEEIPLDQRDQTSMIMAVSTKKLSKARDMITVFRRQLCAFLEEDTKNLDAVYQLSVSLYPVTK